MKNLLILSLFLSIASFSYSQDKKYYRIKDDLKEFVLTPYHNNDMVIWKIQIASSGVKRVIYLDTINGFKAKVPKWLDLKETRNLYFFGGTLPAIGDVENAITISSAQKSRYGSFEDFKHFIIEDPKYLKKSPAWSNRHTIKKVDLQKIKDHDSYKVELDVNGSAYLSNYVIINTPKAYLWINFAATPDTYGINLKKFQEFMKSFEVLE